MKKTSILVVEDNKLLRDGIASILKRQPDMTVVATVGNGENILLMMGKLRHQNNSDGSHTIAN